MTISTTITDTAGALPHGVIELSVFGPNNQQVAQHVDGNTGNQLTSGRSVSQSFTWTAPAVSGDYTVRVSVWNQGRRVQYLQDNNAATITVR